MCSSSQVVGKLLRRNRLGCVGLLTCANVPPRTSERPEADAWEGRCVYERHVRAGQRAWIRGRVPLYSLTSSE